MLPDRLQQLILATEDNGGARWLKYLASGLVVVMLLLAYDLLAFRSFSAPEAMDAAQIGRNLAEGRGFSTLCIRPFSIYLLRQHNQAKPASQTTAATNSAPDLGQLDQPHPDLANAPVYPTVLAGFWKLLRPEWEIKTDKTFWAEGHSFRRYPPEFWLAVFNQVLFLVAIWITYLIARKLFDPLAALLAALLTLGSDILLKFSVSGLSTMLLLVIFLSLVFCLVKLEEAAREAVPNLRRLFLLAVVTGLLLGLGMLTRYAFGWLLVPVVFYFMLIGGTRRSGLAAVAGLVFVLVVTPWILRNWMISGTWFGTAGYAVIENTGPLPGMRLMQSINPDLDLTHWVKACARKFMNNSGQIYQHGLISVTGVGVGVLFLAGLLLGLRNVAARQLRYFVMFCLATLFIAQALGQTGLSTYSPVVTTENLLVLLAPLLIIFAVVFFLTLLDQMKVPVPEARYAVMVLVGLIACQPLIASLFPPYNSTVAYPPYYPPEVQRISNWMKPDELMMSDVPWAVAWYGNRQCVLTTANANRDFYQVSDYNKTIKGLYLTLTTLDGKLFTDCVQGGTDSWGDFSLKYVSARQVPKSFPLTTAPSGLSTGLFITDRVRWTVR